ncbi:MAG: recombinase family protein [Flavobacteriales bacterium]
MKQAILYTRVSTDEQAEKGFSLRHQKESLERHCQMQGYNVHNYFQEDFSAKNFSSRPEFNKLLRYVDSHKNQVDVILFTKWDRFSRNVEAAYKMIRTLREKGIEIVCTEQPLDLSQPDAKVMLAVYLVIPEVENDKNSLRTIDGLRRAKKEGCFTGKAPRGYLNTRNEQGKSTLKPDPANDHFVKSAFSMYSKGVYSSEDVRRELMDMGMKISKNGLLCILKNQTYIGKIVIKAYKEEPEVIVEGLHPALISKDLFNKVQLILKGKHKPKFRTLTEIDEQLPLRGFLICPRCQKNLTGSGSKGRGGRKTYWFYHCSKYCKVRFKAFEVNSLFEQLLAELTIEGDLREIFKSILANSFSNSKMDQQTVIESLKREKLKLLKRIEIAEDNFFDQKITIETFNGMKKRIDIRLGEIKEKIKEVSTRDSRIEKYLEKGLEGMINLENNYKDAKVAKKRAIIQALFSEKLTYYERYFTTKDLDEVTKLIFFRERQLRYLRV